jgi:hypothetical protein
MANKINEGSEFTIPLKNLLSLIAFTGIAVWAYFGIVERIAFLEHNQKMIAVEVEENDTWIDEFKPPSEVQDTIARVRELELKVKELEVIIKKGD